MVPIGRLLCAAAVLGIVGLPDANASMLGEARLEDCDAAVEAFPPQPCRDEPIPPQATKQMRKVRTLLDPTAADAPRRAERVATLLQRTEALSSGAARAGRLSGSCTRVLEGLLRNAQACVARPLMQERDERS
jgi:hypothetical protein